MPDCAEPFLADAPPLIQHEPLSFIQRALFVKVRLDRTAEKARAVAFTEPSRRDRLVAEVDALADELARIREQQILAEAAGYAKPKKARWWHRV